MSHEPTPPPDVFPPEPPRGPLVEGGRAPLWLVMAITALNSLGTGIVTSGIYFLTGFDRASNYLLGAVLGVTYIAGALAIGPMLGRAVRRRAWLSTRTALAGVLLTLAAICAVPWAASGVGPIDLFMRGASGRVPAWSMWVLATAYGATSGSLWPIVESFLSGGRRQTDLRRATGVFNLVWSTAVFAGFWMMSTYVEHRPVAVIVLVGLTHVASAAMLVRLPREPGCHEHAAHEPHPPVYRALLEVCRRLLPLSYLVSSAFVPFLPTALSRMGMGEADQVRLVSVWLGVRVFVFGGLGWWHGWHGRWWLPMTGLALLIAGFGLGVFSPVIEAGGGPGVAALVIGLAAFGCGMAAIYTAALYYAMEVGDAAVEAGGTHEALIGVGYTVGPGIGLVLTVLLSGEGASLNAWLLGTVAAVAVGVGTAAVRRARASVRSAG